MHTLVRRTTIYTFLSIWLVAGGACIDPIDLQINSKANKLVVDGLITDQNKSYTVKISRSLPFDSDRLPPVYFEEETQAQVSVLVNNAQEFFFTEVSPGIYQSNPNDFVGVVGNSYKLKITTKDGKKYESFEEVMPPGPEIDAVGYRYETYETVQENTSGQPIVVKSYGFTISVTVHDPTDARNYYRWKTNGTFEFFAITENPDFLMCWADIPQLESSLRISDDRFFNGNQFTYDVGIAPYDRETRFMARVEQLSMTADAFAFFEQISKQQSNTGSIFDPAPALIRGNIYNTTDDGEAVLGFFAAGSIQKDSVLFNRFLAANYAQPSPWVQPLEGDCREHWPNATNVRPPGF